MRHLDPADGGPSALSHSLANLEVSPDVERMWRRRFLRSSICRREGEMERFRGRPLMSPSGGGKGTSSRSSKAPTCGGGSGKAVECSPTETGWDLFLWSKSSTCSVGGIGFQRLPPLNSEQKCSSRVSQQAAPCCHSWSP